VLAKKTSAAKMKPAYDDDDLDDLDELSDDFECKHKPATKSAAKSAAPVVKKPLATTAAKPAATATKQTTLSFGAAKPTTLAAEKPKPKLTFRRDNGAFEFAKTTCCRLSDSDDKPKVSLIKPPVDAKPKPATKPPVSLGVARGRFFRDARAGDDAEEEAADQQTKPKARANDDDDDGAQLGGGESDFEAPTFAANDDDDDEADDFFFVVGMSFDESETC
jgi:hypothetical protein